MYHTLGGWRILFVLIILSLFPCQCLGSGSAAIKLTAGAQLEKKDEDIEKQEMREKAKADNEKLIMEINKLKAEVMRY